MEDSPSKYYFCHERAWDSPSKYKHLLDLFSMCCKHLQGHLKSDISLYKQFQVLSHKC